MSVIQDITAAPIDVSRSKVYEFMNAYSDGKSAEGSQTFLIGEDTATMILSMIKGFFETYKSGMREQLTTRLKNDCAGIVVSYATPTVLFEFESYMYQHHTIAARRIFIPALSSGGVHLCTVPIAGDNTQLCEKIKGALREQGFPILDMETTDLNGYGPWRARLLPPTC